MLGTNTLAVDHDVRSVAVSFSEDAMIIGLDDGRTVSVPIIWYPRLLGGTPEERMRFELIGDGEGIHWPGDGPQNAMLRSLDGWRAGREPRTSRCI